VLLLLPMPLLLMVVVVVKPPSGTRTNRATIPTAHVQQCSGLCIAYNYGRASYESRRADRRDVGKSLNRQVRDNSERVSGQQ